MYLTENPIGTHVWIDGIEYEIAPEVDMWTCKGCDLYNSISCTVGDREPCTHSSRNDKTGIIFKRCCNVAKLHP